MKIGSVDSREQASTMSGMELAVNRADMPEPKPDEVYWVDLIGLQVLNKEDSNLGLVKQITHNGASLILDVWSPGKQYLIPLVPELIVEIDTPSHIRMDWEEAWLA